MKSKLGTAVFCLLFAIPFGGVGAGAMYAIAGTIRDGIAARDWVRVRAEVLDHGGGRVLYRYSFNDKSYTGDRLGSNVLGGTDNVDSWHDEMESMLSSAKAEGKPVSVFVNPDNPSESMVDREIRWKLMVFFLPFALAFGGVGLGAFYVMVKTFMGDSPIGQREPVVQAMTYRKGVDSDQKAMVIGLWFFAFFWNAISIPIALLFIPEAIANGEWLALLVGIFPLVGVLLLWGAIQGTWNFVRRGGATLVLDDGNPRVGGVVSGHIGFPRGITAGQAFRVAIVCNRGNTDDDGAAWGKFWGKEAEARTTSVGGNVRLPFRFEVPGKIPPTTDTNEGKGQFAWRVEVTPVSNATSGSYGFDLRMRPAPMVEEEQVAVAFAGDAVPATLGPGFESLEAMLGGAGMRITDQHRAIAHQIPPAHREKIAKLAEMAPKLKKFFWWALGIFLLLQILPGIIMLFTN